MSHASCIVALSPEELSKHGSVEDAVAWQMLPFDENGEWFAEGSRWDWWQVGGRYTGKFAPEYDPRTDERNTEQCDLCMGTGTRTLPVPGDPRWRPTPGQCNGCQGKGRRLKFGGWAPVGNTCKRGDLSEEKLAAAQRVAGERAWKNWLAEPHKDEFHRREVHGLLDDDTLERVIARYESKKLSAYAFLMGRKWHEAERLGWFDMGAKTECSAKAEERGEEYRGRCLHVDEALGAQIVTFEEDWERWSQLYWPRFLRNLPDETTLVCVDYHV
jgi:hypothetical protein